MTPYVEDEKLIHNDLSSDTWKLGQIVNLIKSSDGYIC